MAKKDWPDISAMSDVDFVRHLEDVTYLPLEVRKSYNNRVNRIQDDLYANAARILGNILARRDRPSGQIF